MHTDSEEAALGEAFGPLAVFSPMPTRAAQVHGEWRSSLPCAVFQSVLMNWPRMDTDAHGF
jgi:hypothetical protein